jgi:O-antigen/teichoic acid export membrane protein
MADLKTFYRHSSSYLIGRVCLMLLGFISFPIFTRLFSVADYGIMSLITSTILIVSVIAKGGIQNSVQRFHKEHAILGVEQAQRCYSSIFGGAIVIAVVIALLFAGLTAVVPDTWLSPFAKKLLLISACLILFRPVRSMVANLWQVEGNTLAFNGVEIAAKGGTTIAIVALFFLWRRGVVSYVVGTVVVETAIMVVVLAMIARRDVLNFKNIDWGFAWESLKFGFPLMWAEIAYMILDSGDRFLVQRYLGSESVGYYSAAYGIASYVPEVLLVPINLALFPIVMQLWVEKGKNETQKFLSRSLNHYIMAAVGFVCVVSLSSREAMILLASRKYQEAHTLLPILVAGLLLYAVHVFFRPALLIQKKSNTIAAQVGIAAIVNIGLNVLMLPRIGVRGAAYATLISYGVCLALMARSSLRIIPLDLDWMSLIKCAASAGITYALVSRMQGNDFILLFVKVLAGGLFYLGLLYLINLEARHVMKRVFHMVRMRISGYRQTQVAEVAVSTQVGQ